MADTKSVRPTMEDLMNRMSDQKDINMGDKVTGKIIYLAKNKVIIDIEGIGLGVVRGKEMFNEEYINLLNMGEDVESIVIDLDNDLGMVELSFRAVGRDKVVANVKTVVESKDTVEAKVKQVNRGGFIVTCLGMYGFLPASLLGPAHAVKQVTSVSSDSLTGQLEKFVGQSFKVKILSVNEENDSIVVSEKAVTDELAAAKLSNYKMGQVVETTVVGVVDFGLFLRFDEDLEGLCHISEIAWKKVNNPSTEYKVGDKVNAKIIEIDNENRINLSIKQTLDNPWDKYAKIAKPGDKFKGKVSRVVTYGVIINNEDDIQGLCHISQASKDQLESPAQLHDLFKIGESKEFTVLEIDHDKLFLTTLDMDTAKQRVEEEEIKAAIKRKEDEEALAAAETLLVNEEEAKLEKKKKAEKIEKEKKDKVKKEKKTIDDEVDAEKK